MKYVVFVPDGCADEPLAELGDKTPLDVGARCRASPRLPHAARSAAPPSYLRDYRPAATSATWRSSGSIRRATTPVARRSRPPRWESSSAPDEIAYRCNLVTLSSDATPTMVDFAAGHPTNEQSHPIVAALDAALGDGRDGVRFHAGVEYRHLCVVPKDWAEAECTPPHDLTGRVAVFPTGPAAAKVRALMDASREIVTTTARTVGCEATQIWLWGQGARPVAAFVSRDVRRRGPHVVGRRPRARTRCADGDRRGRRTWRDRGFRQRLRRASATRASLRSTIETCSSCTSRRPTRRVTRAGSTSRSTRSNVGTARSSARSSTRSTRQASRTGSCCSRTTRHRARA